MVCLTILYPRLEGTRFDSAHYLGVHVPLAMHFLQRRFGVLPSSVEVLNNCIEIHGAEDGARFHCVCNMHFNSREDASCLVEMRDLEHEISAMLRDDISKYTEVAPRAFIADSSRLDLQAVLAQADTLIAKSGLDMSRA
jgi:hypothetical protein